MLSTLEGWCDYAIIFQVYSKYIIMIQGGSGVVSCDCENLKFFLNFCLVLKQYSNIYFCNYHSFII